MAGTVPMLGAFEVHVQFRAGGMGEVWWGRHAETGLPVAIKVLRAANAGHGKRTSEFENEAREATRLLHRNVILILDYGLIPEAASEALSGRIVAGSPYLVMEYASGGSLREHLEDLDWQTSYDLLLALLDGLAHAHARGVLNRDVKPENVLLCRDSDPRPGPKLADFGLAAREGDLAQSLASNGGTPRYMAPEQAQNRPRDQGPWTDLYALGVLAWEMLTGFPPFLFRSVSETLRAQIEAPLPLFRSRFPVPDGVEIWLRRILQKRPQDRFACAADAACALRASVALETALALSHRTAPLPTPWSAVADDTYQAEPTELEEVEQIRFALPPIPASWRASEAADDTPPPALNHAGLGLIDLRDPPVAGRQPERHILWETLRRVHEDRLPRLVMLRGETGFGARRLARWMVERSRELGAATGLVATHSPVPGPADGLPRLLARHFVCTGLAIAELRVRMARCLNEFGNLAPFQRDRLTALVAQGAGVPEADAGQELQEDQHALIAALFEQLTGPRPLVLVLEDLTWGPDSRAFVRRLLDGPPLPVLVIATCREDDRARAPEAAAELDALASRGNAMVLRLAPLPDTEIAELLRSKLALDAHLLRDMQQRSRGVPLFAVQLLADLVHRQLLEPGPDGWSRRPGEDPLPPESVRALWDRRLEPLFTALPPGARQALEVAAALGLVVDDLEWRGACASLQLEIPEELVPRLLASGLFTTSEGGWAFCHPLLRETIIAEATRWSEVNRACADVLRQHGQTAGQGERLGRFLLAAGDIEQAIDPLLAAAKAHMDQSDVWGARALLDLTEAALDADPTLALDERRGRLAVARVRLLISRGAFREAEVLASRTAEEARRQRWPAVRARALSFRGIALQRLGDLQGAEALLLQASSVAERAHDLGEQARAELSLGTLLRMRGDLAGALTSLNTALAAFETLGDTLGAADCLSERGSARLSLGGDPAAAEADLRTAIPLYERIRRPSGVSYCLNSLGDGMRRRGDLEGAARAYRATREISDRIGGHHSLVAGLNLALVALARGHTAEARALGTEALAGIRRSGRRGLLPYPCAILLCCAADTGDWDRWDDLFEEVSAALEDSGLLDPDLAWLAERAAAEASARGEDLRAAEAARLAAAQRSGLDAQRT